MINQTTSPENILDTPTANTTWKPETYRGYRIRRSGPDFFRAHALTEDVTAIYQRFQSVEATKAAINSTIEHRVMTPEEYRLVYPNAPVAVSDLAFDGDSISEPKVNLFQAGNDYYTYTINGHHIHITRFHKPGNQYDGWWIMREEDGDPGSDPIATLDEVRVALAKQEADPEGYGLEAIEPATPTFTITTYAHRILHDDIDSPHKVAKLLRDNQLANDLHFVCLKGGMLIKEADYWLDLYNEFAPWLKADKVDVQIEPVNLNFLIMVMFIGQWDNRELDETVKVKALVSGGWLAFDDKAEVYEPTQAGCDLVKAIAALPAEQRAAYLMPEHVETLKQIDAGNPIDVYAVDDTELLEKLGFIVRSDGPRGFHFTATADSIAVLALQQ